MYHDHFGFYTAPFSLSPHLHFVYASGAFEETMAHLVYGLDGGEDIILITGEIGTGKTLALHNLEEHISDTYKTCLVNVTQVDFRELLKMALSELDVVVPPQADRADLLMALKTELVALYREGRRLLLIIDEAQNLDLITLEGVRLLTNLGPVNEQVLQIVISGQPSLRAKIDMPELAQIRQRIRVHYHLDMLTQSEVNAYITHRLKVAGCEKKLFEKDALARIFELSQGIPRLVNIIADRALLAAYVEGKSKVQGKHVEKDESLVRSPATESLQAWRAARSSESPASSEPPILPEMPIPAPPAETPPAPAPVPEASDAPAEPPAPSTPEPVADEVSDRSRRSPALGLTLAAAVVIALLAVAFFWPYLGGLMDRLRSNEPAAGEPPVETRVADGAATTDSLIATAPDTAAVDSLAVAVPDTVSEEPPVVEPEPEPTGEIDTPTVELPPVVDLYVQVASFRDTTRAERQSRIFSERGYPITIRRTMVAGEPWFRVYIGPFTDREEARDAQADVTEAGLAGWSLVTRLRR